MSKTQEERKAETRARLLAAASDLFAQQGIDAVSVDTVAEAAGRTSGAVYAHFGSKQGLLLALLDSWKDSVLTGLLAEVALTESPRGQLVAVWAHVADATGADPGRWSLLEQELWLRAARDPEVADIIRVRNAEARRYTGRQLAGWAAAVGARPVAAPEELAVLVKALLTGLAIQRRLDPRPVGADLAVRGLSALLGLEHAQDPAGALEGRAPAQATDTHPSDPTRQEHHHEH
ncbi:MAG: TetR/AcrR family transcriptional regulator [Acidimicrobiales bacterium]